MLEIDKFWIFESIFFADVKSISIKNCLSNTFAWKQLDRQKGIYKSFLKILLRNTLEQKISILKNMSRVWVKQRKNLIIQNKKAEAGFIRRKYIIKAF